MYIMAHSPKCFFHVARAVTLSLQPSGSERGIVPDVRSRTIIAMRVVTKMIPFRAIAGSSNPSAVYMVDSCGDRK